MNARPKIVVAAPWPVASRATGRAFGAWAHCERWSRIADVEIVSADPGVFVVTSQPVAPGMIERRVPSPVATGGFGTSLLRPPLYAAVLAEACREAMVTVAMTPFTYAVARAVSRTPVMVVAQGIERVAASDTFGDDPVGREARRFIAACERAAATGADSLIVPSTSVRDSLLACGAQAARVTIVDVVPARFTNPCPSLTQRLEAKASSNLAGRTVIVFIGSDTRGNTASAALIAQLAPQVPDVYFVLAGSIYDACKGSIAVSNVGFTGVLPEAELAALLRLADACIEPGVLSSGLVSAKLWAYAAAGAPIISCPATARVAGLGPGTYFAWAAENEPLATIIRAALSDRAQAQQRGIAAHRALGLRAARSPERDIVGEVALGCSMA